MHSKCLRIIENNREYCHVLFFKFLRIHLYQRYGARATCTHKQFSNINILNDK